MGNCPSEFAYAPNGNGCIVECPSGKGFELTSDNGYSCVYKEDRAINFPLKVTPIYFPEQAPAATPQGGTATPYTRQGPKSYKDVPNHKVYEEAILDFNEKFTVAMGKVDKEKQTAAAFANLQAAENVRDQSPDAYEKARIDYYTLTKGETWLEDEKQRVANTEAVPLMNKYLSSYSDLVNRTEQQKQTIDAVNGVKDNVLGVADDMRFSVAAFEKQLTEIKNQIEIDKKKKVIEVASYSSWFDLIMNILIALVTCVAIFFVGRAVMKRVTPSTPITPPTT
jgi:hypothetical protein